MPPAVSIVMPAFNAATYIGQAIGSVAAQTFRDWELVIVDDASTDTTAAVVESCRDPRVILLRQDHQGESAARNTALRAMRGEYLAFLDADDLYLPGHLETGVGHLRTHPENGGVYTDGYYIDTDGHPLASLSSRRRGPFEGDLFEEMVRASDVFGASTSVILRTDIVRRHGLLFDPGIVIGPDWEFLMRYSEHARFGFVDARTCCYRMQPAGISRQTGEVPRMSYLARCRENSVRLGRFRACSPETRAWVFHDLLVNLLDGNPAEQSRVAGGDEFQELPDGAKAKLFRYMAAGAILRGDGGPHIAEWLGRAAALGGFSLKNSMVASSYALHPKLCRLLLESRRRLAPARKPAGLPGVA